jgi:NADPH-dependent ferric siderophore reductase
MNSGRASGPRFLIIGDANDLPGVTDMLGRLPIDAYGQVLLEVASEIQVRHITAPAGMSVTWLCRDRPRRINEPLAPRGELAARALTAWIAEWMPETHTDQADPYVIWIGCATSHRIADVAAGLSRRLQERDARS